MSDESSVDNVFVIALVVVAAALGAGGGAFYWYRLSQAPDFSSIYATLGISALPRSVEQQQPVSSRLAQLGREPCYTEAAVGLGDALLDAGYPREAASSLRNFARRCGRLPEVLPLAYVGLERINDFSGALDVATELVVAAPSSGQFRYWRALAYDKAGKFALALPDYMNAIELSGDLKTVSGDVFYKLSRAYAALSRYCDAIAPIETYVSLDPTGRRTPQTLNTPSRENATRPTLPARRRSPLRTTGTCPR
jgi:tetratricopeptide (TPR) repeat protein